MRFQTPPNWPSSPDNWIPDPGWTPDASWPPPPAGWRFWVNDYGVPIQAPAGLYGAHVKRVRKGWLAGAGAAAGVVTFLVGVGVGGAGSSDDTKLASLSSGIPSAVTSTVTSTVTAAPVTATQTLPARTVTSVKTVKSVKTVTKTAAALPLTGGGGGSVYYDTCADARAAGDTPLYRGDAGYSSHLDRDGDGVACE